MVTVTEANFDTETAGALPVIVDVWGEHCGSCTAMEPVLRQIEAQHGGQVKVCKLNLYENQAIGLRYNIRALPTFLFFKNGELTGRHAGTISKDGLLRAGGIV